jgi:hypothetical protein
MRKRCSPIFGPMSTERDTDTKIVTLDLADRAATRRRALEALKGRRQGARISFETPEKIPYLDQCSPGVRSFGVESGSDSELAIGAVRG